MPSEDVAISPVRWTNGPPTAGPGDKTWSLAKIMRTYSVFCPVALCDGGQLDSSVRRCGLVIAQIGRLGTGSNADSNDLAEYLGGHTRA